MKTVTEFCKIFKITRGTFYNWERKGLVKVVRIRGIVRITDEEVERLRGKNG